MKTIATTALAGLIGALAVLPSAIPAAASDRDRYIQNYYSSHPRDRGYWQWRDRRSGWGYRDYGGWYRGHSGDAAAAAIFGLAAGAIIGGAIVAGSGDPEDAHVRACYRLYRSYD